jgi:lipopolysaccharide biosynthesis protein
MGIALKQIYSRILGRLKRSRLAPIFGGLASSVPFRWIRKPTILSGDQVCLFVTYTPDGTIPAHALFHARAWAEAGFKVNLTVVLDRLEKFSSSQDLAFAAGVLLRANQGYDFGAWAATIAQLPELRTTSLLCIANDSVYGPLNTFSTMIDRIKMTDADVIGLTESYERTRHFQSYMMLFRQNSLCHPSFIKFWRNIRTGDRSFVIQNYELKLMALMEKNGLRTVALYPMPERGPNPTLMFWRELIADGFPFLKVQLLRDNPLRLDLVGWESLVKEHGFNPDLIREHLRGNAARLLQ